MSKPTDEQREIVSLAYRSVYESGGIDYVNRPLIDAFTQALADAVEAEREKIAKQVESMFELPFTISKRGVYGDIANSIRNPRFLKKRGK